MQDFLLWRPAKGLEAHSHPLADDQQDVGWAEKQIPAPQPPGFGAQAKQPFQAAVLHPLWRLPQHPGSNGKGRAHSYNGQPDAVTELVGPHLLPWTAKACKDDVRP